MPLGTLFIFSFYMFPVCGFFGINRLFICHLLICHLPTLIFMGRTAHAGLNETKQQIIAAIVSNAGNHPVFILC